LRWWWAGRREKSIGQGIGTSTKEKYMSLLRARKAWFLFCNQLLGRWWCHPLFQEFTQGTPLDTAFRKNLTIIIRSHSNKC